MEYDVFGFTSVATVGKLGLNIKQLSESKIATHTFAIILQYFIITCIYVRNNVVFFGGVRVIQCLCWPQTWGCFLVK